MRVEHLQPRPEEVPHELLRGVVLPVVAGGPVNECGQAARGQERRVRGVVLRLPSKVPGLQDEWASHPLDLPVAAHVDRDGAIVQLDRLRRPTLALHRAHQAGLAWSAVANDHKSQMQRIVVPLLSSERHELWQLSRLQRIVATCVPNGVLDFRRSHLLWCLLQSRLLLRGILAFSLAGASGLLLRVCRTGDSSDPLRVRRSRG
mmetsp:Transcript_41808/g.95373  ORF Transcript_41808/g.95373 Transcript_41808/m.95373 type:complete len:204 (-) Transcript_41808:120-731(-)